MKPKFRQIQFLIQKVSPLKDLLNKLLLSISVLLILFSAYITNYMYDEFNINNWVSALNIYRFSFLLIFFVARKTIIENIGNILYRLIIYILINHFIDRYFELNTWSFNDGLTLIAIIIEYIAYKKYLANNGKDT